MIKGKCFYVLMRSCLLFFLLSLISSTSYCYVTPEQFGACGDGVSDDTKAFIKALNVGREVVLTKTYRIKTLDIPNGSRIVGHNGSSISYYDIIINNDVKLEGLEFNGEWKTKGLRIVGSNVSLKNCRIVNTKGVKEAFGGLTASVRVGQYSDVSSGMSKYHNITIEQCCFDGCSPLNIERGDSENESVARFVMSYCCDNLNILNCSFNNLLGTIDSDAVHVSGYEIYTPKSPFYCNSEIWAGNTPPYKGYMYSPCNVTIEDCYFVQKDCKSSIKIMSSNVNVINCTFDIMNSRLLGSSYSVIRVHYAKNIKIIKNRFNYIYGDIDSFFKVGVGSNVMISDNYISSQKSLQNGTIKTVLNCAYSEDVVIKRNKCVLSSLQSILYTEYNQSLNIYNNEFKYFGDMLNLYGEIGNHYTYPVSKPKGRIIIKRNRITCDKPLFNLNKNEYPTIYKKNRLLVSRN